MDDLKQDCSISIANALEIQQSCIKPLTYNYHKYMCPQYTMNIIRDNKYD